MSMSIILKKQKQDKFKETERYQEMSKRDKRAYDKQCEDELAMIARNAAKRTMRHTKDLKGTSSTETSATSDTSSSEEE